MSGKSSYRQILRSSAVMGGAQAINYMVGLLRIKVVAVLLGPAGVGVIGLYTSASNLVGAVTGLGLQRSAVRTIASADGDPVAVARATRARSTAVNWHCCAACAGSTTSRACRSSVRC